MAGGRRRRGTGDRNQTSTNKAKAGGETREENFKIKQEANSKVNQKLERDCDRKVICGFAHVSEHEMFRCMSKKSVFDSTPTLAD